MKTRLAVSILLIALCGAAFARECTPQVRDGWIRLGPAGMSMMAGFGRVENRCPTPITITSASSAAFADASLHETRIVGGMSRMRAVRELRLAPEQTAVLKPGGLHLMLMQPRTPLKAGSKVAIEFALSDGRKLLGEFEVRKPAGL